MRNNKLRILVQTQLSNYNTDGKFILEADSGWQMVMGRVREMLKDPDVENVDIMCPDWHQVATVPWEIYPDISADKRVQYLRHNILRNALATRYDFDFDEIGDILYHQSQTAPYTHVYINDPMLLRHYRALFFLKMKYMPKFFVHSHFIDNPECPKFPTEASLWFGQLEAALKADWNFWSAMEIFLESAQQWLQPHLVEQIREKSTPWDDGYSQDEITTPPSITGLRFNPEQIPEDKVVIFVPNRVGGKGRSSDYTNCGKFLFEICNELWEERQDFVVIAGNPSQKFSNDELDDMCQPYLKLIDGAPTRNEYRYIGNRADISVGLYDQDSYGGTAARELLELNCLPLWVNRYEYRRIAGRVSTGYPFMAQDLSDVKEIMSLMIDWVKENKGTGKYNMLLNELKEINFERCSYESTTPKALEIMKNV
jgi:hypothetical protein